MSCWQRWGKCHEETAALARAGSSSEEDVNTGGSEEEDLNTGGAEEEGVNTGGAEDKSTDGDPDSPGIDNDNSLTLELTILMLIRSLTLD